MEDAKMPLRHYLDELACAQEVGQFNRSAQKTTDFEVA
jgi:hypothetical protein